MNALRFVLPYAKTYWLRYLTGLVLVPVNAVATLAIPWLTGECVRHLMNRQASPETLHGLLAGLVAVAVVSGLSLLGVRWFIIGASRFVEYDLRNRLFAHLQHLDRSYYNDARTGDLMSRATSDVERVRLLVGPIVLYASRTSFLLLIGLPVMISISFILTLMVMVPLSLMTIAVRILGPKIHREVFKAQETLAELSSQGQEDFSGIRVVKSFVREDAEMLRFDDVSRRYFEQNMRAVSVSSWMQPIVGAVGDLALISLLLIGGLLILDGRLGFDDFVEFAAYQLLLIWPMLSIGWVVNQYHRARASVDRLHEVFRERPLVEEAENPVAPPGGRIRGDVSIRGLTFRYGPDGPDVLSGVDLEAPQGSTVAIIGRTGAGKSTLIHMIPRILQPPDGTVFVDGVDVNRLPLSVLRRSVGFVPQESFLFSRTVRENITFGTGDVDPESVYGVAATARFDKDIDQFREGYEEMVGERGVTLSGGQKQRAALARALLIGPRILILDDAFSAVDTETEEEILRNLHRATQELTTIVVSHRVSSIAHADAIYVLDDGRVVEQGTHEELLRRGGIYAELQHLQQLSDELDSM